MRRLRGSRRTLAAILLHQVSAAIPLLAGGDAWPALHSSATADSARKPRTARGRSAIEGVHTEILRSAISLRGSRGSSEISIYLDPWQQRRSAPILRLLWDVSGIVDLSLSTLTVELDDAPMATLPLRAMQSGRTLEVSLSGVSGGFHRLIIRTRLLTGPDPCQLPYDRELWLRLLPTSAISYKRLPPQPRPGTVAGVLADWQALGTSVAVRPELPVDRGGAAAYLLIDRWLRQHDLHPTLATDEKSAAQVRLQVRPSLAPGGGPGAQTILARLERHGADLSITARSSADLETLAYKLLTPGPLTYCLGADCFIPRTSPPTPSVLSGVADPPVPTRPDPEDFLSLAQHGYPRGFTARGAGFHLLRLHFPRPPRWQLGDAPQLSLQVAAATTPLLDRTASSVSIRIGDRPVASYSPASLQGSQDKLLVKLPPETREQSGWDVEVEVHLRSERSTRCAADDDTALWLTISPGSGLAVPHEVRSIAGTLASLLELSREQSAEIVYSPTLNWPAVAALAAVLSPLARAHPLAVVKQQVECRSLCILPQLGALPPSSSLTLVNVLGDLHWLDKEGLAQLPLLPARSGVLLELSPPAAASDPAASLQRLAVQLPPGFVYDPAMASPDFDALLVRQALWSAGRWLSWGAVVKHSGLVPQMPGPAAPSAAAVARIERRGLPRWLIDGFWLLGTASVLFLAARAASRRRKPSPSMHG